MCAQSCQSICQQKVKETFGRCTYATISRIIMIRLPVSSLYFRSSLPELLLSVVATLIVVLDDTLRIPGEDSEERRWLEDDVDGIEE